MLCLKWAWKNICLRESWRPNYLLRCNWSIAILLWNLIFKVSVYISLTMRTVVVMQAEGLIILNTKIILHYKIWKLILSTSTHPEVLQFSSSVQFKLSLNGETLYFTGNSVLAFATPACNGIPKIHYWLNNAESTSQAFPQIFFLQSFIRILKFKRTSAVLHTYKNNGLLNFYCSWVNTRAVCGRRSLKAYDFSSLLSLRDRSQHPYLK